ncbi:dTDP-4-dehydrorhamnose 3,5-epimerase [Microbulbifer elongatus]|uniref:dTDP-4-dehydrorhamnose 3,5-epimerase n=1 Tax=Microbulbifer elongatus TaxID=86173 RepID=UPI001CFCD597|nr:dTDP-4-dehydrorhamnose 3,5-epimerase [Microbulbifer elongatus]
MKFVETPLSGAYIVDIDPISDDRGFFSRAFCIDEFEELGIEGKVLQANLSWNPKAGTLRGMHYQVEPYQETKLVRCTQGALYDVIIDLRKDSSTFGQSYGVELSASNRRALFVPRGFAHGFVTLSDNTEAYYLVSERYQPGSERGIRWSDPRFAIDWPLIPDVISDKDANWPDYSE